MVREVCGVADGFCRGLKAGTVFSKDFSTGFSSDAPVDSEARRYSVKVCGSDLGAATSMVVLANSSSETEVSDSRLLLQSRLRM
jgi:hypothetical protein